VPGVQVGLVHRPVAVSRDGIRVRGDSAPEVADRGRVVVDSLDLPGAAWAQQQRRERAAEWIHEVGHVGAEPAPEDFGDPGFAAEPPREGCSQVVRAPSLGRLLLARHAAPLTLRA
jgi:hypothetical protein